MKLTIALAVCKLTIWILRLMKRGATALPGKLALMICPDLLNRLADRFTTIMVTGTNGKTSTAIMISGILTEQKIQHISNKSGSNLERGIVAAFAEGVTLRGNPKAGTYAVIECDEAAFRKVCGKLRPLIAVVTNFFKDQLDRYGEVTNVLALVREGIEQSPGTTLVLNGDDHLCASLGLDTENHIVYYGIDNTKDMLIPEVNVLNESGYCIYCQSKYEYTYEVYGHLGGYHCPTCGYERPVPDYEGIEIEEQTTEYTKFRYIHRKSDGETETNSVRIYLPGTYNIYNALAAIGCAGAAGLPDSVIAPALEKCRPGFGRMEQIPAGDRNIKIVLVKNPTGFNQVINFIGSNNAPLKLLFAINDKYADGTDISWLWDVNFEQLEQLENKLLRSYVCGIRGDDMAVRLKYAGIPSDDITVGDDTEVMLSRVLEELAQGENLIILPTYTAMLEIRALLQKRFDMKDFWT